MRKKLVIISVCMLGAFALHAQDSLYRKPAFRKNYNRLGLSFLGNSLNKSLNPEQNMVAGNFGAGTGFVLDAGHIYYFRKRNVIHKVNYGLDWTYFSFVYNKLKKWGDYGPGYTKGAFFDNVSSSAATKLGPVVAWNPTTQLVVEARIQAAYLLLINNFTYDDLDAAGDSKEFFTFNNQSVRSGLTANFGLTVRYTAWGLAFEYIKTNFSTPYSAIHNSGNLKDDEKKIPLKNLQLKLSFSF